VLLQLQQVLQLLVMAVTQALPQHLVLPCLSWSRACAA
jgi:hypothetical protein